MLLASLLPGGHETIETNRIDNTLFSSQNCMDRQNLPPRTRTIIVSVTNYCEKSNSLMQNLCDFSFET
jgi:hypothetical protein